jgi:hypothetical protein
MMGCVSLVRRPWFLLILFGLLILITRWPLAPGQLFTFDDVNLAYSMGHYDIRMSQPHPPGYPLFVLEMRILHWLRFKRAESILLFLALAGSILAMVMITLTGSRILGGNSGFWAAWMMLLHPVFWHAGVTSALRVQLAVISLAVAAQCWRVWEGDARYVRSSAVVLAIGAGIRPETGLLLFPLWAVCAWRSKLSKKATATALVWMAGVVLIWLLPAMFASGGPLNFVRANLDYVTDQASVSSGLFGATDSRWITTMWRLLVWVFCGVLAWGLPAALAFHRKDGFGITWDRVVFLALWFVPALAFALTVHVEDPGQTLAMVPIVCIVGGHLVSRAIETWGAGLSRLLVPIAIGVAFACERIVEKDQSMFTVQWLSLVGLAMGVALRIAPAPTRAFLPRPVGVAAILSLVLILNYTFFRNPGWYYKGAATSGVEGFAQEAWADINTGFSLTSLQQIRSTLAVDDHTLQEMRRLIAERPRNTIVIWEEGLTAWRKAAYYAPGAQIAVLEHKKIQTSPPVVVMWRGATLERSLQGSTPLQLSLPSGGRVVWLLNARTSFFEMVQQTFALTAAGPIWYTDLAPEHGTRRLGAYELSW